MDAHSSTSSSTPTTTIVEIPHFAKHSIELLSSKMGGKVLGCSNQWFAPCENLINPQPPIWKEGVYVDTGKWMDGWETARHNPTFDWAILKLGIAGNIYGVEIDTQYFTGNYPPFASLEVLSTNTDPDLSELLEDKLWLEILPKVSLGPGKKHYFPVQENDKRWTHIRFKIEPDGGVARLRVYGKAIPDWSLILPRELVDLAAIQYGGVVIGCSDMYFGNKDNIISPGRSIHMGDGWETKRRRGPGYDWLVIRLGNIGLVKKLEIDTNWFKGNFPTSCSVDTCYFPQDSNERLLPPDTTAWREILPNTKLKGHQQHYYVHELINTDTPTTHIRLNIFPDGGVSRFRVFCYKAEKPV